MRGQFECDLTWFCFCFDFVHMHDAVVRAQIVQMKQVDCKMTTKNATSYKQKTFRNIVWATAHTKV